MKEYTYKAFISYRHMNLDKKVAEKLQKMLEEYKPPKEYRRSKKRWRVFRDETELPTSSNLSEDIEAALRDSEFLIVVCSKATAQSRWCMEEITQFKELHNGTNENIITLLIEGDPEEVFPKELCTTIEIKKLSDGTTSLHEKIVEPLAANISAKTRGKALKKLKSEFLRIVAPLLGCGYDDLYNRNHRRKMRRLVAGVAAAFIGVTLFGVYSSVMLMQINEQKNQLQAKNEELELRTQELNISNSNLESTNNELDKTNKELDDTNTELENTNTQLDTANLSLTETNNKLDSANSSLIETNNKLDNANSSLRETNNKLDTANTALSKSNKDLDDANTTLQETNNKLQQTNDQLDKSNEELQTANDELDSANTALTQSNADLAQKTKEANDNLDEANTQRDAAEANLEEANRQKTLAEANMEEANKQKEIAEENMRVALENEAKANEANRNLKIKNSEILANQAQIYYDQDNITSAIETAIEALSSDDDIPKSAVAERVLTEATGAYSSGKRMLCNTINLSGYVKFLEFAADGTHILAEDSAGNIYIIDYENDQIIKTYSPLELYNSSYNSPASDIYVDGNTGYVYSSYNAFVSINLNDGNINWKYNDLGVSGDIVTNINSDNIFMPSSSSYCILSKDGSNIYTGSDSNNNYKYNRYDDHSYMDNSGRIYATNIEDNSIGVLESPESAWQRFPMPDGKYEEILSMGENEDCLFVNCLIKSDDTALYHKNAQLICFNKNDMSIKWQTSYTGDSLYSFYYNGIFNLTHNVPDDNGNYSMRDGIIVISGRNILAFDKQTGEQYFKTIMDYGNEILYCEPNEKYTLQLGTRNEYSTYALARHYEGSQFSDNDSLIYMGLGSYSFDKERAYIAHTNDTNFALASDNSSEISLYHQISWDSYIQMAGMPTEKIGNFDSFTDNEDGIFAAYVYDYAEKEKKNYIIIYDINNKQLMSYNEIDISIEKMMFVKDKLFIVDNDGIAEILDFSGNVQEKLNLGKAFREQNNLPEDKYLSLYNPYITKIDDSVLYCIGDGILKINLSDDITEVKKCLYYSIDNYSISNNFVSFMAKDNRENKIGYYEIGNGSNISCVQDNNNDFVYQYGAVSSLINTDNRDLIAFINNEGYIGIYKCGDNSMSKIMIARGEAVPLKIQFSPDAKYILALCANGEFIKYSVDTLEEVSKLKVESEVSSYTVYEFIDDNSFFVKSSSSDLQIFDFRNMELKGTLDGYNYMYFMKKDKKILCTNYSSEIPYGYYKYLTTEELIERGKEFLAGVKKD